MILTREPGRAHSAQNSPVNFHIRGFSVMRDFHADCVRITRPHRNRLTTHELTHRDTISGMREFRAVESIGAPEIMKRIRYQEVGFGTHTLCV